MVSNMKAAILIAFASLFGNVQGQGECGNLNSTQIQAFTDQYNKTDEDKIRKSHIDGLKEAIQSICGELGIDDEDPNIYTEGNTFYMCQMVNITENQKDSTICNDDGHCVSLGEDILSNYWDWQCTEKDVCNGVKVALVMFDQDLYADETNDTEPVSFVGNVFILNPITNCVIDCIDWSSVNVTFILQDYSVSTTTAVETTTTETETTTVLPETTTTSTETTTAAAINTTTASHNTTASKNATTVSTATETTSKDTSTVSTNKTTAAANTTSSTQNVTSTASTISQTNSTLEQTTTTEETTSTTETLTTTAASYVYQCFRFDGQNRFWRKGGCDTYLLNDTIVICTCSEPGPIRVFVIEETDEEDNFTSVTVPPCIPITTTNEPTTTQSEANVTMDPSFVKVECTFSFPNPYDPNDENSICSECQNIFNMTNDEFQDCGTSNGSTIVQFSLIGNSSSVSTALNIISDLVSSGKMTITINGVVFAASKDSFKAVYTITLPPPTSTPDDDDDDGLTDAEIAITVVCVVIGVLGLIVIAVVVYLGHKKKHKKRPVSPSESATPITLDAESNKHSSNEKHHKGKHNPTYEGDI